MGMLDLYAKNVMYGDSHMGKNLEEMDLPLFVLNAAMNLIGIRSVKLY